MEVTIALIQNVTLLIAIVSIYSLIVKKWHKSRFEYIFLSGILFGITAVAAMTMPYVLKPGVILDARTVIHSIAGFYGGPLVGLISAIISSIYRYQIGGAGAFVGIINIIQSTAIGVLFHLLHKQYNFKINAKFFFLIGILANVVMLLLLTFIAGLSADTVLNELFLPVMLIYPLTTIIIGNMILRKENEYSAIEALKSSESLKSSIVDAIPDLLIRFDSEGNYVDILTSDENSLAKPRDSVIGKNICEVLPPDLAIKSINAIKASIETNSAQVLEYSLLTLTGYDDFEARIVPNGNSEVVAFVRNISERKIYENQLEYFSKHDRLTGLYNRAFFEESLASFHKNNNYPISVIAADIDGLKLINDALGHKTGDDMLISLKNILKKFSNSDNILARIDGDEFAIVLSQTDAKAAEIIANAILDEVENYNNANSALPLSLSLGVSTAPFPDNESILNLLNHAETSLYRNKTSRLNSRSNRVVQALIAALEERDYITNGHADRVEKLCLELGEALGLSNQQLSDLSLLSRVHDLGKVGIPDNILFKPSRLEADEWEIMKQHPEKGYRIAVASIELSGIAHLILKHHEHWNGNGYPLKLEAFEIPIECRILSIVDAFDAITNDRPYSKARSKEDAIIEIKRCAGKQFDPEIVEKFVSII